MVPAPGLVPPCMRQRFFPCTAGDWHGAPGVFAPQRGAFLSCMGLISFFIAAPRRYKLPPGLQRASHDGLVGVHVDMLHRDRLLAAVLQPMERHQRLLEGSNVPL